MIFDPILDESCEKIKSSSIGEHQWMWHKYQRVCHLHKKKLDQSLSRFNYVGYPGTFRQPSYVSYFKNTVTLLDDELFSFKVNSGRIRMNINGEELDVTNRSIVLNKGVNYIKACVDFCSEIPAFAVASDCALLKKGWVSSLDDNEYYPVQSLEKITTNINPLDELEDIYRILPKIIKIHNGKQIENGITLGNNGDILIDFGYYELGFVSLIAKGSGEIEVIIGQSEQEVKNTDKSFFEQKQMEKVQLTNETKRINTSVQALKHAFIIVKGDIEIKDIVFNAMISPVEYKGKFACSDKQLDDIYKLGCASVHSCMHSFYLDAIYRDALPWALDGLSAMMASNLVFNERIISRNQVVSQLLPRNASKKDLGIVYLDFQLYAILGLQQEYLFTGDEVFLKEHMDTIFNTIDIYLSITDERGYINSKDADGMSFFPDWSAKKKTGPDTISTPTYAQMIFVNVIEFGARTAKYFNHNVLAKKYEKHAKVLRMNIVDDFLDKNCNAFYNGLDEENKLDRRFSVYAQSFGILYDFVNDYSGCVDVIKNMECKDKSLSIHFPWEIMALSKSGSYEHLIKYLKDLCMPIIDEGVGRIYEDINYDNSHTLDFYGRPFGKSLCHSVMGAAPILGLVHGIASIFQDTIQPNTYHIIKSECGLSDIKCKVPTVDGFVFVEYKQDKIMVQKRGKATIYIGDSYKLGKDDFEVVIKR